MNKIEKLINELCPDGVEFKELGEICEIKTWQAVSKNLIQKNPWEYPVINSWKEPLWYIDRFNTEDDPIGITSRWAWVGSIIWCEWKYFRWNLNYSVSIKDKKLINKRFLYHYLLENKIWIQSLCSFNWIPALNASKLKTFKIPLPPLDIQKEIVKILDNFTKLEAELEAELEARMKQYEYYRDELLSFGNDVEWRELGEILNKNKWTKITASKMKELHKDSAPVKIFAGGKTFALVDFEDIPEKDIYKTPSIIVKSRWIVEFEYYNKSFSHKNEFWSYYSSNKEIDIKYIFYFLKTKELYFQTIASKMQMPQISQQDTEKFKVPIPSLEKQEKIVEILDKFDKLVNDISEGLPAEIEARKKQYEYYRGKLLEFKELGK